MVQLAETIDTAIVGVSYAFETTYGWLPGENGNPGTPVWFVFEPNEISDDTGVEMGTAPRVTINSSGQREKGELVALDGAAGLTADVTQSNFKPFIPGHLSAPLVETGVQIVTGIAGDAYNVASTAGFLDNHLVKGFNFGMAANNSVNIVTAVAANVSVTVFAGQLVAEPVVPADAYIKVVGVQGGADDIDVDVATYDFPAITSTVLDFTTLGLTAGQFIFVGSDNPARAMDNAANNGYKRIYSIAPHALLIDKSDLPMVAETNNGNQVQIYFGDYIKNVSVTQRVKQTAQWETTLGVPDLDAPGEIQARYLKAADLSDVEFGFPIEDKCSLDLTFIASDEDYLDGGDAPKAGTRAAYVSEGAYNTSSDEWGIRLCLINDSVGAPLDMAGAIEEMTLTISSNKELQKKQSKLGSFKSAQGVLEAEAEITFYFATLDAMRAARANSSCTLDVIMAKENAGFVIDFPFGSINSTPLNYGDLAIKQTTTFEASRGRRYNAAMDHTVLMTWFAYLPDVAMPTG